MGAWCQVTCSLTATRPFGASASKALFVAVAEGSMTNTFILNPQTVAGDGFEWKGRWYHLTYKNHLPKEDIMTAVRKATSVPLMGWSIVHERAETLSDDGTEAYIYDHTHVALMFQARLGIKGAHKFDVYVEDPDDDVAMFQIHPNVQHKMTLASMELVFTQYHRGRKYNERTGKVEFIEPFWLEQHLPPMFEWSEAVIQEVINAPTLKEACIAGAVRPRSVTDIKALRDAEAHATKKFQHKYEPSSFKLQLPANWHALHLWGGTGLGKTKFAVAQFSSPLVIKPFNSIGCVEAIMRKFDPNIHNGLVLDEADLRFMNREQAICFLDPDEDCEMDVRFKSFTIPSDLKMILISNPPPGGLYPPDPAGAIARRLTTLQVRHPTWLADSPPIAMQLQHAAPAAARTPVNITPAATQRNTSAGRAQTAIQAPTQLVLTPATAPAAPAVAQGFGMAPGP